MSDSPTTPVPSATAATKPAATVNTSTSKPLIEYQKRKRHPSTSSSESDSDDSDSNHTDSIQPNSNKIKRREKKKAKSITRQRELTPSNQPSIAISPRLAYPRGWSQLNIDFIESITILLEAVEISYLHRTCHAWLHIADHIRTPHLLFSTTRNSLLMKSHLIHSLVRRHVKDLAVSDIDEMSTSPPVTVTPVELKLIAHHLPKLQGFTCSLACANTTSWIFPSQLKELNVSFNIKSALSVASLETVSDSVNQISSLTHLKIYGESTQDLSLLPINLQPLTRLVHSLTELGLNIRFPTMEHIQAIRQLANLVALRINGEFSHQGLAALLAEPIPFRLGTFEAFYIYSNEDVPLLKRLSHLTELTVERTDSLTDYSFLPHMVQLCDIIMFVDNPGNLADSLYATSYECLTSLMLDGDQITDQDLTRIFSRTMPVLKKLQFYRLTIITSLAFMDQFSSTLEEFSLFSCPAIEHRELVHLRFFPHLSYLDLDESFPPTRQLDTFTLALIDPDSPFFRREWFPALQTFNYHPNQD